MVTNIVENIINPKLTGVLGGFIDGNNLCEM
jgi:hypothetical protein